jgi:hypothetical protein
MLNTLPIVYVSPTKENPWGKVPEDGILTTPGIYFLTPINMNIVIHI